MSSTQRTSPEPSLATLLKNKKPTAVLPVHKKVVCGTSRQLWPQGVALLAVGLHHSETGCAYVLMPRPCGHSARRLSTVRLDQIKIAKPLKGQCPPPATKDELKQLNEAAATAERFLAKSHRRSPKDESEETPTSATIFKFPSGKAIPDDKATAVA